MALTATRASIRRERSRAFFRVRFEPPADMRGEDVRRVREKFGYSQTQWATWLQVDRTTVNRWEHGKLGVHPAWAWMFTKMLTGEIAPPPPPEKKP